MKRIIFTCLTVLATCGIINAQCLPVACTYSTSSIPYSLSPVGTNSVAACDDCESPSIPLGFQFGYMCSSYSSVQIVSNGFITFDLANTDNGCCAGGNIPDPATPNGVVALFWTDLYNPVSNSITYTTVGTPPNRIFVVTYSNVPICCGNSFPHTGQIKLFETSGIIEMHLTSIPNSGNTLTQGIEDVAGASGYTTNVMAGVGFSTTNTAVRYTPITTNPSVTIPTSPSPISGPTVVCSGTTVASYSVAAIPSATFVWTLPGGWTGTSTTNVISTSITAAGVLTVAASYSCGTSVPPITLSVGMNGSPSVSVNNGTICSGQSFTISPSGANSYSIQGGNAIVTPTANASYTVVGSNFGGCLSVNVATCNINVNAAPNLTITGNAPLCSGGGTNIISATGASTYSWSTGATTSTISASPSVTTVYTVTGTSGGCSSTYTVQQGVGSNPTVTANSGTMCSGTSFTINPSGANTYSYSGGSAVVSPTANTLYTVTGTSTLSGCTGSAVSNVNVVPSPTANLVASTNTTCINGATIGLLGSPAGGTYGGANVSGSVFTPSVAGTFSPTYVVTNTVTGCSKTASTSIVVSLCTGIASLNGNTPITNVYPNPTSGLVTLDVARSIKVAITNSLGQVVLVETLNSGKQNIDLRHLSNGIYILKFTDQGKEYDIKLIKE